MVLFIDQPEYLPYNSLMREWELKTGDPLFLVLCADARLVETSYIDDHIWELSLRSGNPSALAFQTTFGLRAISFRLFPRFSEAGNEVIDPEEFFHPPVIRKIFPNYICLEAAPFENIDVLLEYWVPHSQNCCGRITLVNLGEHVRQIGLSWIGQLTPHEGERMAADTIQSVNVLSGRTGNLKPVLFMSGAATSGSGVYPSLYLETNPVSEEKFQIVWSQSAFPDQSIAFDIARAFAARKWDAEIARLEILASTQMEIFTGYADWDASIMFSQKLAVNLVSSRTSSLPYASFVESKTPDQGYSTLGTGTDYDHLWNGQTALNTLFISGFFLPSNLSHVEGFFKNFISIQEENGFIDWKPGLAGQRSRLLATPVLAHLAWQIYQFNQDRAFVEEVFDPLRKFLDFWTSASRDRDGDEYPEWDHILQIGFDDHPLFGMNSNENSGVDITTIECCSLGSFLYQEFNDLSKLASILGLESDQQALASKAEWFKNEVNLFWNDEHALYLDRDRDTHLNSAPRLLAEKQGPQKWVMEQIFSDPARLFFSIITSDLIPRKLQVVIKGKDAKGKKLEEKILPHHFKWHLGKGNATTQKTYKTIQSIDIQGINAEDIMRISVVGFDWMDLSQLLPLWAGIPDEATARNLIENTILNPDRFQAAFGFYPYRWTTNQPIELTTSKVDIPFTQMALQGMLKYGFRRQACEIFTRLVNAIIQNLRNEHGFRRNYTCQTGSGTGEKDHLLGIIPVDIFMELLGVKIYSPRKVELNGYSPFPWPVKILYRGLSIIKDTRRTKLIFPDDQEFTVDDPKHRIVFQDNGKITEWSVD
jgi:hypothetical protein